MKNPTPKQMVGKEPIWGDCKCFCHNEEHCKTPDCSCAMCYKKHQSPPPNREKAEEKKYKCGQCGYETDIKHKEEWENKCYQCYADTHNLDC